MNRLRRERLTRALSVGLLVFALVAQAAAVFTPAPTAQATVSNPADNIVYQGTKSKADLLAIYDQGHDSAGHADIQQIYSRIGITRADLANASQGTYYTDDASGTLNTLGRMNWNVSNRSLLSVPGASTTIYTGGFLQNYNHVHYPMPALIGHRAVDGGWFAITLDCGNVVYVTLPPAPVKNISVCRPGTGVITIKETDRQSTDLAADSAECQPSAVACNTLSITPVARDTSGHVTAATFTTDTTATNATLDSVTYVVKDSEGHEVSRSSSPQFSTQTPGTYSVQAVANFTVKGQAKTVTSTNCQGQIMIPAENQIVVCRPGTGVMTIPQSQKQAGDLDQNDVACHPKPPVVTATPTPPAELPHTGPADTFVGALGLALMAGAGYYYWDSRRLLGTSL
jgi:hypothetical protein